MLFHDIPLWNVYIYNTLVLGIFTEKYIYLVYLVEIAYYSARVFLR